MNFASSTNSFVCIQPVNSFVDEARALCIGFCDAKTVRRRACRVNLRREGGLDG
jgi:hypothetical protein